MENIKPDTSEVDVIFLDPDDVIALMAEPEYALNLQDSLIKIDDSTLQPFLKGEIHSSDDYPDDFDEVTALITPTLTAETAPTTNLPAVNYPASSHRCFACEAAFDTVELLLQHVKVCQRPYKCEQCDKHFSQRENLRSHRHTHNTARPHQCDQCELKFKRRSNLVAHLKKHSGDRPFECGHCDKTFSWKGSLVQHEKKHSGDRPHPCDECGKKFARRSHLLRHQQKHTGERPFECEQCEKTFFRKSHLVRHRQTHVGDRRFHCDQCEENFARKRHLTEHKKSHAAGVKCDAEVDVMLPEKSETEKPVDEVPLASPL